MKLLNTPFPDPRVRWRVARSCDLTCERIFSFSPAFAVWEASRFPLLVKGGIRGTKLAGGAAAPDIELKFWVLIAVEFPELMPPVNPPDPGFSLGPVVPAYRRRLQWRPLNSHRYRLCRREQATLCA